MLIPLVSGEEGGLQLNEFGIDPNLDPELALALKLSMEEEAARIEREKQGSA
jgi:26S proteasome regulatory subunit N10